MWSGALEYVEESCSYIFRVIDRVLYCECTRNDDIEIIHCYVFKFSSYSSYI